MRPRTVVVAIATSAACSVAGSLAARGTWWPLIVVAIAWCLAMWRLRVLDREIAKLDAENENEGA